MALPTGIFIMCAAALELNARSSLCRLCQPHETLKAPRGEKELFDVQAVVARVLALAFCARWKRKRSALVISLVGAR